jgi:2',3'-cyclic-nucleotide 2'-phosphodiesterase (5'-nucleotidase family)
MQNPIIYFTIGIIAIAWSVGCSSKPKLLTVIVSGDTQGWITPCGCAANQSGGLARRAKLVEYAKLDGDVLLLDVGGSSIGTTDYQRLKFESLLTGLRLMDLAVMNIGSAETQFTPQELADIGNSIKTKWLSSNLKSRDGNQIFQSSARFDMGGLQVDVAGVIDPELVVSDQWQATDAVPAIVSSFKESKADVRIVLAYFNEAGLRKLAEALPDVDFIIGGPTGQSMNPTKVGRTTILSATNKGKFVAKLMLKNAGKGFESIRTEIVEVASKLQEVDAQVQNLNKYYDALAKRDFAANEAGLVKLTTTTKTGYSIAGTSACVKCHVQDDRVWDNSKHSHAWNVLTAKKAHFDPHCQQCHTTGYGLTSGFVNVASSKSLVHVGCENCHGPSQAHVDDPKKKTPFQAKEQCIRCHDHENSPSFVLDAYWQKIVHGKPQPGI